MNHKILYLTKRSFRTIDISSAKYFRKIVYCFAKGYFIGLVSLILKYFSAKASPLYFWLGEIDNYYAIDYLTRSIFLLMNFLIVTSIVRSCVKNSAD